MEKMMVLPPDLPYMWAVKVRNIREMLKLKKHLLFCSSKIENVYVYTSKSGIWTQ